MAVAVKVGSWGPLAGEAQDIAGERQPQRLESITIYISEAPRVCVCGFSFVYVDQNGEHVVVGPWGMPNDNPQIIPFVMNPGEYVNSLSGTFDDDGITSLKFTTNQDRDYGPNGSEMGIAFSVPLPANTTEDTDTADGAVVAFFGRSDHTGLKALGIYVPVMQGSRVMIGPWGGSFGERVDIDGTPVELRSVRVYSTKYLGGRIYGFSFTYIDQTGNLVDVPTWGNAYGPPDVFLLREGEYVKHISGTVDYQGVTSLTFTTNLDEVHGPYGPVSGTAFSVPRPDYSKEDGGDGNGAVVGFFGRSGGSLIAIGFYISVPGNRGGASPAGRPEPPLCTVAYVCSKLLQYILRLQAWALGAWGLDPPLPGKIDGPVKVGPWCGFGRAPFDVPPYGDLPGVTVATSGQRIRAIEGTNESEGQGQPPDFVHFYLGQGEYIKDMSGSFDDDGVTSLTFTTNQNTVHGPFGQRLGTDFSVPLPDDNGAVVGFSCYDGNAIAAYIGLPPDPAHPARPRVQIGGR